MMLLVVVFMTIFVQGLSSVSLCDTLSCSMGVSCPFLPEHDPLCSRPYTSLDSVGIVFVTTDQADPFSTWTNLQQSTVVLQGKELAAPLSTDSLQRMCAFMGEEYLCTVQEKSVLITHVHEEESSVMYTLEQDTQFLDTLLTMLGIAEREVAQRIENSPRLYVVQRQHVPEHDLFSAKVLDHMAELLVEKVGNVTRVGVYSTSLSADVFQALEATTKTSSVSSDQIASYQIVLWTSIILILSLLAALCVF